MTPLSPYRNRTEITPTSGGSRTGAAAIARRTERPRNSYRWKRKASGMPIAAESMTVATEINRLFVNASRLDGVAKKCRYVSNDNDPSGKKLRMNVNAFG